jgi:hypothetical protein
MAAQPAVPVPFWDLQQYRVYTVTVIFIFTSITQQQPGLIPIVPAQATAAEGVEGTLGVTQAVGVGGRGRQGATILTPLTLLLTLPLLLLLHVITALPNFLAFATVAGFVASGGIRLGTWCFAAGDLLFGLNRCCCCCCCRAVRV